MIKAHREEGPALPLRRWSAVDRARRECNCYHVVNPAKTDALRRGIITRSERHAQGNFLCRGYIYLLPQSPMLRWINPAISGLYAGKPGVNEENQPDNGESCYRAGR